MNNKRLRHLLMSYTPKLTLMLCAIGSVTDNTDWLFYACYVCIFLLFLLTVVYVVTVCMRDHKKVLSFASGSPRDKIDYTIISIVGIITDCLSASQRKLSFGYCCLSFLAGHFIAHT